MSMKRKEFLAELADLSENYSLKVVLGTIMLAWYEDNDPNLVMCPITAVCHSLTQQFFCLNDYQKAAKAIGMSPKVALRLARAADANFECDVRLNREMRTILANRSATDSAP